MRRRDGMSATADGVLRLQREDGERPRRLSDVPLRSSRSLLTICVPDWPLHRRGVTRPPPWPSSARMSDVESSEQRARAARAAARRATMVVRKTRLGEELDFTPVAGPEALSLVTRLTLECWAMRGEPCPPLDRRTLRVRFVPFEQRDRP